MLKTEWHQEKIERHLRAEGQIPFGVSYLDDALIGILPNDLILVGARTGRGKTELATTLAYNASKQGRKVAFFALEADQWEIQARLKYRRLRQLYEENYAGSTSSFEFPLYREWLCAGYSSEWDALEKLAEEDLERDTGELRIVYPGATYTAERFVHELEGLVRDGTKLIVIDHLHYFDFGQGSETEGLKRTIHAIRNAALYHGVPVVLLAHLRKGERASGKTLPDLDDFHGHSDIVKVATTVLLLSPVPDAMGGKSGAYPTYFHVAKARTASYATPYVAVLGFDVKNNAYSDRYHLWKANFGKDPEAITDPDQIPRWAKRAHRPAITYYARKP